MSDLSLNIKLTYDDSGLKGMKDSLNSLKKVMNDLNRSMPKMSTTGNRTMYGQMASDVRALGNAVGTTTPKIDRFVVSLNKLNLNLVRRSMQDLTNTSASVTRATGNIVTAQTKLRESLDRSTTSFRSATAATKAMSTEQSKAAQAQAALIRAQTAAQAQQFKQDNAPQLAAERAAKLALQTRVQAFKEEQAAIKQMNREQLAAARTAQQSAQQMSQAYQSVIRVIKQLADIIRSTLTSAIRTASTAISGFATSAASRFASLRAQLDATGKSFLKIKDNSTSAGNAIGQLWSGDALIRSGRNLMQFVNQGNMLLRQTYTQFSEVEKSISRAAVAGIEIKDGKVDQGINMEQMWDFVYKTQRGEYGNTPIRSLTTQELADSIYYLTSAIGVGPNDPESSEAIANMVGPMSIWASATKTDPETFIKGVLGIGQQFGFDPRQFDDKSTAQAFSGISGMVGYLANVSSMEPTDVIAAMRMVGPSSFNAYGGNDVAKENPEIRERAMFDTFLAMFAASETGLRGSQVGRGYQRLFSGFADATPKTRGLISGATGIENTDEAYKDWLYNDQGVMDFKVGSGEASGILGIANFLRDFKQSNGLEAFNDLIYGLFTENATRAMASTIAGMDSEMYSTIEDALATGDFTLAYELLAEVMKQETALISNAVTNLQNAWGQFANSIFRTSNDMIIGGLDALANVFREISVIIMDFPALGKALSGAFSVLMVGGGLIGGLLVLAGTIVSLNRAFGLLHISAGIVGKALVMLPLTLLKMVPMLFLIGAAIVALKTAWDNNFLGMRDGILSLYETLGSGDFSGMLLTFMGTEKFEEIYKWTMRLKSAFTELISGIFFNVGGTNNLGAMLYTIFGQQLGSFFYENLLRARTALSAFRTEIKSLVSDLGGSAFGQIKDFANLLVGFMEVLFTGSLGARGFAATEAIGEMLGIEGFTGIFGKWAKEQRGNFIDALQMIFGAGGAAKGILANIGDNLGEIFTFDNLMTVGSAVMSLLSGFAQGLGIAFMSALKAVEAVTSALSRMGTAGRFIADMARDMTGLNVTLNGLAQAVGIIAGVFVGSRLLAPILLFNNMLRQGAVYLASFAFGLAGMAMNGVAALAALGPLGAGLAGVLIVLGLVLAGMVAFTAYTGGMDAALAGLVSGWNAFRDVMTNTVANLVEFGKGVANFALEISGISSGLLTFESLGRTVGDVVSVIAYAAAGAIGAIVLFGAALFRIGREYGPALLNNLKQIAPVALGLGAAFAIGILGAVQAMVELTTWFTGLGDVMWATLGAAAAVWLIFINPIAGVLVAISLVGLAFLAITGDAETMSSSVAGIVATLPEPWQAAADEIIIAFARVFDYINKHSTGLAKTPLGKLMGLEDTDWTPSDSLELQYKSERGQLTVADVESLFPQVDYFANETKDPVVWNRAQLINRDADDFGLNLLAGEHNFNTFRETNPSVANSMSMKDWEEAERIAIKQRYAPRVQQQNQMLATFAPNQGSYHLIEDEEGKMHIFQSSQITAGDLYDGLKFSNPVVNGINAALGRRTGGSSGAGSSMDPYGYWTQQLGVPIKSDADLQKHLTSPSMTDIPMFDEVSGLDLPAEWKAYQKQKEDYLTFKSMVDSAGLSEATRLWGQISEGGAPPTAPAGTYAQHLYDIAQEAEDGADAVDDAAAAVKQAMGELRDAMLAVTDPFQATATHFDFMQGNGILGGSGASFLNKNFESISSAIGDSAPWWNQNELLADAAGMGFIDDNMYGVNTHEALRPLFERIEAETGVAYETLIADVPKWFAPEPIVAIAAQEIYAGLNKLPEELYNSLDQGLNMDWSDFINYGASQTAAGDFEWDITDYWRESLGWNEEQIQWAIDNFNIDPSKIGSTWLEGSEMLALSMASGVNVIDEATWDAVNQLIENQGDATTKIIKMTREQFDALSDEEKRTISLGGYTVIIEEPKIDFQPFKDAAQKGFEQAKKWIQDAVDQGFKNIPPVVTGLPNAGSGPSTAPKTGTGYTNENDLPQVETGPALPPRTIRTTRKVNTEVTEEQGEVTVKPLDMSVLDTLLNNAVLSGIGAMMGGGVERTERTRTETVKVNIEFEYAFGETGGEGGYLEAAQAMAAQFVASFSSTVNEQLPAALSAAVSGAMAGLVLGGEEGAAPISIPIQLDTASLLGQLTNLQLQMVLFTAVPYTIRLLGDNVSAIAVLDVTRLNVDALVATDYTVTLIGNNEAAISAISSVQDSVNTLVDSEYAVVINATDNASTVIGSIAELLSKLNGSIATVTINTVSNKIPGRATGGIVRENMTLVGEQGPELVSLPWGSKVYPYQESMRMLNKFNSDSIPQQGHVEMENRQVILPVMDSRNHSSQNNEPQPIQITFGDVTIHGDQDIDELAEKIDAALSKKWGMASRGQVSVDYRTYDD